MAQFLNSSGISYHLEKLIKNANERLFLVSPFLKLNEKIKQLLDERNRLKLDIRLIYGKTDLQSEESKWLNSMDSIKILFCKNLHAKCYLNENEAIITSMNLYDFSQQNNNEMGVYIRREDDAQLYKDILDEVTTLIRTSEQLSISVEKVVQKKDLLKATKNGKGHCIRCDEQIKMDVEHPFCLKCYRIWKKTSDKKSEEKHCQGCGKPNKSSFEKPICYSCYKKNKKK